MSTVYAFRREPDEGAMDRPGPATRRVVSPPRVLVVDSEAHVVEVLSLALGHVGFDVQKADSLATARAAIAERRPDAVILDVALPDGDGIELCRRLRIDGVPAPVLFLSATDSTAEKVRALSVGGDDFVTKPFVLDELIARLRAVLRRTLAEEPEGLTYRDLRLDETTREVHRANRRISLTPTEFRLLRFLVLNADHVLSKQQILDHVWPGEVGGDVNVVETYVSYLRKKLDRTGEPLIRTIRGIGYVLRGMPA
jgi:two-component system OmpR family response regulator